MQEVQLLTTSGVNVATGATVTASNTLWTGSLSMIVDGAYQYSNNNNDVLVRSMTSPWIELNLGREFSVTKLQLYVNNQVWQYGDDNWTPGNNVTLLNDARGVLAVYALPSNGGVVSGALWRQTQTPYVINLPFG